MTMEETPRTNALVHPGLDLADAHDIVDLCRKLETELSAARMTMEELMAENARLKDALAKLAAVGMRPHRSKIIQMMRQIARAALSPAQEGTDDH